MNVLVVEDSRTQAQRLKSTLTRAGHEVEIAVDGEAALALCRAGLRPDAVISDVLMPGIDGFELCKRLRGMPRFEDVPVLLLTALDRPTDVLSALAAGASQFMTKPYSDERLLTRLAQMMLQVRSSASDSQIELQGQMFRLDVSRARLIQVLGACLEDAIDRNEALEAGRVALERSRQQREEVIHIVAHELRTPLSSLLLRATLTQSEGDPVMLAAMPRAVEKQVHHMVRLIDDLVGVTEVDLGTLAIDPGLVDLAKVVHGAVERVAPLCTEHEIDVTTPDSLEATVDAGRIEQVIANLLTNAVKYSSGGTKIQVRLVQAGEAARVEVIDQGIGIEPEALERVFERKFRTARGMQSAEGLGLGLYLCKRLIELHGGEITAERGEERGSTFAFAIPLK